MAHNDNTINIFDNYEELQQHSGKTRHSAKDTLDFNHYRYKEVKCKGHRNIPQINNGGYHTYSRVVDFAARDAVEMRNANFARYIKQFNERNNMAPVEELRHTSLWLDSNHNCLNSYHGVDTYTKFCTLHLKNEHPYLYMGIELEVTWDDETIDSYRGDRYDQYGDYDEEGDYDEDGNYIPDNYPFDIQSVVREALKIGKGLFTAENDGSLPYGISAEFVSRPLSSQAWHCPQIYQILKEFTDYLKSTGAMVEQPNGNGFHIHVSKKFFTANPADNRPLNEVGKDLNWVFQKFQEEIETVGGREYNGWCSSAKMNVMRNIGQKYGIKIDKAHIDKDTLEVPYNDHGKCFIDSSSGETFEARVFHSTLDPQQILACIEFMRNASHGARENALDGKTFGQITRFKDAPNLQAVIKRARKENKKLYLGKKNTKTLALAEV